MSIVFESSRHKVEWAEKHILHLHCTLRDFANTDFYTVRLIEEEPEGLAHSLRFDIDLSGLNFGDMALMIGDVLHNLRSALDHLYYGVVLACDGKPTSWTRFPITDSREESERFINSALEKKQITVAVADFILNTIKPYQTGNPPLWGLHKLNIRDKHEMVVPVLESVAFHHVSLENNEGRPIGRSIYVADKSCVIPLTGTLRQKIKLKDKGRASINIIFNIGAFSLAGQTVYPSLKRVSEGVSHTIDSFELLGLG